MSESVYRIEMQYAVTNEKSTTMLTGLYDVSVGDLAAAVEAAQAAVEEDSLGELKAKEAGPRKLIGGLVLGEAGADPAAAPAETPAAEAAEGDTPAEGAAEGEAPAAAPSEPVDHLAFLRSRRECKPDVLNALKTVLWLLTPDARAALPSMAWADLQSGIVDGSLPWDEMLSTVGSFDVMASTDAEGFDGALSMLPEDPPLDEEALKASSLITFLLFGWLKAAKALFTAKKEKEEAEAAAAAAAAEAAAAEAAAAAAEGAAGEEPAAE